MNLTSRPPVLESRHFRLGSEFTPAELLTFMDVVVDVHEAEMYSLKEKLEELKTENEYLKLASIADQNAENDWNVITHDDLPGLAMALNSRFGDA